MLTDLVLFRHAKAVRHHEAPTDRDRALTPRGRHDAERAAAQLAAAGFKPDAVLVSPAVRTRETWAAAAALKGETAAEYPEPLYLAEARDILREAEEAGAARVLVIGHNPGLHDLACELARAGRPEALARMHEHFPTSAIAWLHRPAGVGPFMLKAFFARPGAEE
jgi:phosphohistidine phosphatase